MGPVDITAIGVWNYQNLRAREHYYAHMYYLDTVARRAKPKPKKDFSEPKKLMCEWPGCPEKTRSKTGFCRSHAATKHRKPRKSQAA